MNQSVKYSNRYNSVYTLTKTQDGNILWKGDFQWCRYGWPNVYDDAYNKYLEDGGQLSLKDFIEQLYKSVYDSENNYISATEINQKYGSLVYSDKDKIDMVDPSGGPYLSGGTNMGMFDESFKGMIIEEFKQVPEGYLIVIKK